MDDFNRALSSITARVRELCATIDQNTRTQPRVRKSWVNEQINEEMADLIAEIVPLYTHLSSIILALPQSPSLEHTSSSNLTMLATSIDNLIRTQDARGNFKFLCQELVLLTQEYKKRENPAHLAELGAMRPLAKYPALLSFPSCTAGLSYDVARAVWEQINAFIAPKPAISLERVLLLTKGLLMTEHSLDYHSIIWFLRKACSGINEHMSDEELGAMVGEALRERRELVDEAEDPESEVESSIEDAFGDGWHDWTMREPWCCNPFKKMTAEDVLDVLAEKFEKVKKKLCVICACKDCRTVLDEGTG